jgi:hypothetical protein
MFENRIPGRQEKERRRRRRGAFLWVCCCLTLPLIAILSTGVGVGVGITVRSEIVPQTNASNTTTTTTIPTTVAPTTTTTTTMAPTTTTTTVAPTTTTTTTMAPTTTTVTTTPACGSCEVNDIYLLYAECYSCGSSNLILHNPVTNITQHIGKLSISAYVLFVEPVTNNLFTANQNSSGTEIFQINKCTAEVTSVCFLAGLLEPFFGSSAVAFQSNGDLWLNINSGPNYTTYSVNLTACTYQFAFSSVGQGYTMTFFNSSSPKDLYYLTYPGSIFLKKAVVPTTPAVTVGNTGVFVVYGLGMRLFSYCLNNIPTLEMYWQQGTSDFQFRQLNPVTGVATFNNVTYFNNTNINPWAVTSCLYCA